MKMGKNLLMKITTHLSSPLMKLTHLQKTLQKSLEFYKSKHLKQQSFTFIHCCLLLKNTLWWGYMWKYACKTPSMEQKSFEQSNINKIKFFFGLENLNFTSTHKQPPRSKATKEVKKMTKFKDCAIRVQTCIIVDMTSLKKMCILNCF